MKIRIEFTENEMKETVNLALDMCDNLDDKVEFLKALETKSASVRNNIASIVYDKEAMTIDFEVKDSITVAGIALCKFFATKIKDIVLSAFDKVKNFVDMIEDKAGKTETIIDGKKIGEDIEDKKEESKIENEKENENKSE